MSLRQIAKQLGISPAYLSYMVNGKRPWRPDLYDRYSEIVNTVNRNGGIVNNAVGPQTHRSPELRFELGASVDSKIRVAGARGSRTHHPGRRAGVNGFEVREAHQNPFAPISPRKGRTLRSRRLPLPGGV